MKAVWLLFLIGLVFADDYEDRQSRHLSPKFWNHFTTSLDRLGEQVFSAVDSVFGGSDQIEARSPVFTQSRSPASAPTRDRLSVFNPFDLGGPVVSPFLNLFDSIRSRNWWEGPNVCIERSETDETSNQTSRIVETVSSSNFQSEINIDTDIVDLDDSDEVEDGTRQSRQFQSHIRMSSCQETATTYVCTTRVRSNGVRKIFKTKYSCCYGNLRSPSGFGCAPVEVKSLSETLLASGARSFATHMQSSAATERMGKGNYTFFVPVDAVTSADIAAANDVLEDLEKPFKNTNVDPEENEIVRRRRDSDEKQMNVMSHVVAGIYMSSDLKDEMVLSTEDKNSKIRFNEYHTPQYVITANCKRLTKTDQFTNEGVVHFIEGEIQPAAKSLLEIVRSDPKYSSFYQVVLKAGLEDLLDKPGQLTLFAPTNEAFEKLPEIERERLLSGKGCVETILRQHLLPNVICSAAVQTRARTRTLASSHVLIERTIEGSLKVEGNQILVSDVIGTNGILHQVDAIFIPDNAKTILQTLEARNFTEFLSLLDSVFDADGQPSNLRGALGQLTNFTLFAPSNSAVRNFLKDNKGVGNGEKLKEIIQHHIAEPEMVSYKMKNNEVLKAGKGPGLRMNTYSLAHSLLRLSEDGARSTAQCAPLSRTDIPVCGGVIHIVESVLTPPAESVWDLIQKNNSFSILKKLIEGSELVETLKKKDDSLTFLAPPDAAFYQLPEETLSEMLKDSTKALPVLKQHILPEYLCCAGIQRGGLLLPTRRQTLSGGAISIQRLFDGVIAAGDARVLKCDSVAQNGVLHVIDKVLIPQATRIGPLPLLFGNNKRLGFPGLELVLFG